MVDEFDNSHSRKNANLNFNLFRHFQLISLISIIIILIVACLGLRLIFRKLVLHEAERDAIRISAALRDSEIYKFFSQDTDEKQTIFIPKEKLAELDRTMRLFLTPFDIVKIKIFDSNTRIVYSTDLTIIGKLDPDNAKLLIALAGTPISKHEKAGEVWDMQDEERKNIDLVETYIPMKRKDGQVVGSFEIYKDVTYDMASADKYVLMGGGVLLATVLIVFTALMFVIHRAIRAINFVTENLMATNVRMERKIKDRKRLEKELLGIIERERQRIGQELHDGIGQQLTGIEFMTEVLGKKLDEKNMDEEKTYAVKINKHVKQATVQAHNLAKGLHPMDLEKNGLVASLQELAANTGQLFDISCNLISEQDFPVSNTHAAINIYRITQEAITNAIKHGKAKNITIELIAQNHGFKLTVENDGMDFPETIPDNKGMGLRIMDHRAEIISGSVEIKKALNGGTLLTCIFPNEIPPK